MKPWFWNALFWFVLLTVIHRIACWGACRSTIEGYVAAWRQWAYTLGTLVALAGGITGVWWLIHITLADSSCRLKSALRHIPPYSPFIWQAVT